MDKAKVVLYDKDTRRAVAFITGESVEVIKKARDEVIADPGYDSDLLKEVLERYGCEIEWFGGYLTIMW